MHTQLYLTSSPKVKSVFDININKQNLTLTNYT